MKLCYLQGKFALLPGLYAVCEPTRLASATALHETSIRNEAAYYQCVFQTLDCRRVTPGNTSLYTLCMTLPTTFHLQKQIITNHTLLLITHTLISLQIYAKQWHSRPLLLMPKYHPHRILRFVMLYGRSIIPRMTH